MARLVCDPETGWDFDRIFDYFTRHDPVAARETIGHVVEAMKILVTSPMLGQPTAGGKRELVVRRGTRGFIGL